MPQRLLLGLLTLFVLIPIARAAEPAKEEVWLKDYAAARKLAKESGKPLFVVLRCEH